jgi:outer membrane protein TolC
MVSRLFLAVSISFLLATVSFAGEEAAGTSALSFETFSQKVLAYYPKLKAAHSDVDIALAQQMQAKAGFWPSLDLSAGYKITDDPVNVFGMKLRQERFKSSDFDLGKLNSPSSYQDFSAGVHIDLPIFDALQTIYRARAARDSVKAAESDQAFTKMEALLVAQDAYLNAVTLEALSAVVDEVQKRSDEDLQKASDLKDKGMILGADYYAARVAFGDFTRMRNELTRQKKAMMALLNILMGEPADRVWMVPSSLQVADVAVQDPQALLETAFADRPDLKALDLKFKAAALELSRERAAILPSVSAFGDATNDRNKANTSGGNNYTVGVKAEMSLFDPSRGGRIREAKAKKDRLDQNIQLYKDGISRDIMEEVARHEAFQDNMSVLKGMSDDAKEGVDLVVPLYSEGRKSIADLLEMRGIYLRSVQAYQKALMGLWMSEGRLLFLTGRLDEASVNKLAEGGGL